MKLTRRKLAAAVVGSAAAACATAQDQPAPAATPDADLQTARTRLKSTVETISKQDVPMATEPAFEFRA